MCPFGRHGAEYLSDFFSSNREEQFFSSAFVEPPIFNEVLQQLQPLKGIRKVVIIDGHPRSGKTWLVAGALAHQIDAMQLRHSNWWSSGLDSEAVFPSPSTDLLTGLKNAVAELQERAHAGLKFILLDDLLGPNEFRPLPTEDGFSELQSYFTWDHSNPLLQAIPEGSTLVVTSRSMFFTLLELYLEFKCREEKNAGDIRVNVTRCGVFRDINETIVGMWNSEKLAEVAKNNRKFHPYAHDPDPDALVLSAPLLAFDRRKDSFSESQVLWVARMLFGEDIITLYKHAEPCTESGVRRNSSASIKRLQTAYVMAIAPGLLFIGPAAYDALGIGFSVGKTLERSMYFSDQNFWLGRMPNEFYMIGLQEHFSKYLDRAVTIFRSVIEEAAAQDRKPASLAGAGLGLRGFIERARIPCLPPAYDEFKESKDFQDLYDRYQNDHDDALLRFEYRGECSQNQHHCPGLAAAISWARYKFFRDNEKAELAAHDWYILALKELVSAKDMSAEQWDALAAFYSTFLQWALQTNGCESDLLTSITTFEGPGPLAAASDEARNRLKVILGDELLWALLEKGYDLTHLDAVKRLRTLLKKKAAKGRLTEDYSENTPSRFLTLAWHNAWLDDEYPAKSNAESRYTPLSLDVWKEIRSEVHEWMNASAQSVIQEIQAKPGFLDWNLQYHWCHFITQLATWMRDWCFHEHPNLFARQHSQVACGSRLPKHNKWLALIVDAVLDAEDQDHRNPSRIRNALFLAFTRRDRFPQGCFKDICNKTKMLLNQSGSSALRGYVAQAIFELDRQGFLERAVEKPFENEEKDFRVWCYGFLNDLDKDVWNDYWNVLRKVTHPLDLLPRKREGLQDVKESIMESLKKPISTKEDTCVE